jgi:hypothetical protein
VDSDPPYAFFFGFVVIATCLFMGLYVGAYLLFRARADAEREANARREREEDAARLRPTVEPLPPRDHI